MNIEVKRNASTPYYIAWENGIPFHLSADYIRSHYGEKWKLDTDTCRTDYEFISTHELGVVLEWKRKKFNIRVAMDSSGITVICDCGKQVRKLCEHAGLGLLDIIGDYNEYFKKFHKEELDDLLPDQLKLFKLTAHYYETKFDVHPLFGRVYNFENREENRMSMQIIRENPSLPRKPMSDNLRFIIPYCRTFNGMPFFLPFLSTDIRGKKFGKSYLLDPELPQPDHLLKPTSLALENISRKMVELYRDADKLPTIDFQKKMVSSWKQALSLTKDHPHLNFAHTYGRKLEKTNLGYGIPEENMTIVLAEKNLELHFTLLVAETYSTVGLSLLYKGEPLNDPPFVGTEHAFFMQTGDMEMVFIDDLSIAIYLHHFRRCGYKYTVLKQDEHAFFMEVIKPLTSNYDFTINPEVQHSRLVKKPATQARKMVTLSIVDEGLLIEPLIRYGENVIVRLSPEASIYAEAVDESIEYFHRDKTTEQEFSQFLEVQMQRFYTENDQVNDAWLFPLSFIRNTNWLAEFIETCTEKDVEIKLSGIEQGSVFYPFPLTWKFGEAHEVNDQYHLELQAKFGENVLSIAELKDIVFKSRNMISLERDQYGWIGKAERDYFRPVLARTIIDGEKLIVPSRHILALDRIMGEITSGEVRRKIQEKKDKLNQINAIPLVPVPDTVRAVLRPYQITGFSWMVFLKEFNWGGILADEMGLGKTLQVITLLEHYFKSSPKSDPALIVVPNSLLFNWANEIEKFAPERNYLIHHGPTRPAAIDADPSSLVITTYGTLMADHELFTQYAFSYFVLDESQSIKNRLSKRFKAAESIKADHLIALSGTPIENGIEDLYTQINLVNPNFFGSFTEFKRTYEGVVDGVATPETMLELQRTIDPFLLRRTKRQVASELPEKTETILYLDMLPEQRKIYDQYRLFYKSEIESRMESSGVENAKFLALEGLMKLRQVCNSPCLLKGENHPTSSAKIEKLIESLQTIVNEHKVLVFSFFTSMLHEVSKALDQENITYAYLDGKMNQNERHAAVEKFQTDDNVQVFLISLRAGGTGLNLTAADYVYILDPWWNPAVESQAIGRSHRIGQDRPVMAYKTICRNSVEEGILALQQHKRKLAEDLILEETNLLKTLDKEDILRLFS